MRPGPGPAPAATRRDGPAPLHLMLPLWGHARCEEFLSVGAATLLAPGNLPARVRPTVVSIYTTRDDWAFLDAHPVVWLIRCFADVVPYIFELSGRPKHNTMSAGHEVMITMAERDRALAVPIFADSVFADGDLGRLVALARPGRRIVMTVGLRASYESFVRALPFGRDPIVSIAPRDLARLAIEHQHSQMRCWLAEAPGYGTDVLGGPIWRAAPDGVLTHSIYWEPALVDFSHPWRHDPTALRDWTIDGHYPWVNTTGPADYHAVTDSDEFFHLTTAREAEYHFEPTPMRGTLVEEMRRARSHPTTDPLRQTLYETRVRVHGSDVDASWESAETAADRAVAESRVPIRTKFVAPSMGVDPNQQPCRVVEIDGFNIVKWGGRAWTVPKGSDFMRLADPAVQARSRAWPTLDRAWDFVMEARR